MRSKITPREAANIIIDSVRPLPGTTVTLTGALDRVLARDIHSAIDVPHWDNSAMDGYAVRSEDILGRCPVALNIIERVPAGASPEKILQPGECARIFTGAPVPAGADGVVRQEHTTPLDDGRVRVDEDTDARGNVRRKGEDIPKGSLVFSRGTQLGPAHLGVLASVAETEICVHRAPVVAILASGDEIVDPTERDSILQGKKIASSNTYTLTSMVRRAGGEVLQLGIAPDDPAELRRYVSSATEADFLITTGGVSVGEHDYLRSVLEDMGADIQFWRIRMRPGAPVGFGLLHQLPWLGLPGNPVSAMVGFELFARPAIRRMLGHDRLFRRAVTVTTEEPIHLTAPLRHFLRIAVHERHGKYYASLTGAQGSGILSSMARADALMIVPEDRVDVDPGSALSAILLEEPRHVSTVPF
ncbi:MAG: gephyrin-like molybdotransferase Glp [Gemmatimonadales bacterium]